jgi:hypothetical protein
MAILGLKKLNRKLKALPAAAEVAIKDAMAKGADEIVAMMKNLVPVDTGDLRDSISWHWGSKAPKGALALGGITSSDGKLTLTIFASDWKARFVEFGTAAHTAGGIFKGATIPAIKGASFFFGSYRALRKRTRSRITRAITKSAKQVAAGGTNA